MPNDKVILVDCDGVLMNWEHAFHTWMDYNGYVMIEDGRKHYDMGLRYNIPNQLRQRLIRKFNESAAIGFLPPLRDAMYYIDLIHRKHGYVFHMITALSNDPYAQKLRIKNTEKLFGKTAFEKYIFCDTGADKDEVLEPYRDRGYLWVEDKPENALLGHSLGLNSIIMEHAHNMNSNTGLPIVKNWEEIYNEYI